MTVAERLSVVGAQLIKTSEGVRLTAYKDQAGVWTIGYGHTQFVHEGMKCTRAQAEQWFVGDAEVAVHAVLTLCLPTILTQPQLDALTSFVFNFGAEKFRTSTLRQYVQRGDFAQAAVELLRWVHTEDPVTHQMVVSDGLVSRRAAERRLLLL